MRSCDDIPALADGLADMQRRNLYTKQFDITTTMNVAKLAHLVAMATDFYGHNKSYKIIIKMGQKYIRANDLPLFKLNGQARTRFMGGEDAAEAQHIEIKPSTMRRSIFPRADDSVLTQSNDVKILFRYIPVASNWF